MNNSNTLPRASLGPSLPIFLRNGETRSPQFVFDRNPTGTSTCQQPAKGVGKRNREDDDVEAGNSNSTALVPHGKRKKGHHGQANRIGAEEGAPQETPFIPVIDGDDISDEVEARLKLKEESRQRRKQKPQRKRKRGSGGSSVDRSNSLPSRKRLKAAPEDGSHPDQPGGGSSKYGEKRQAVHDAASIGEIGTRGEVARKKAKR